MMRQGVESSSISYIKIFFKKFYFSNENSVVLVDIGQIGQRKRKENPEIDADPLRKVLYDKYGERDEVFNK